MSSNSKPTSSDLRKPQPNTMTSIAQSRGARILSPPARLRTSALCPALNQFSEAESELPDSIDAANPSSPLGTQQASIGGLGSQATQQLPAVG
jgi:hypothetical protein